MCIPEPGQVEQEINAILAQKAFPNVNILHPKSTSIQALNEVLERCQKESMTSTIQNGRSQAVLIIDTFLNDLERQTAECDQSQELALRTTYERVSAN